MTVEVVWIAWALAGISFAVTILILFWRRAPQEVYEPEVIAEWRPTGKINAVCRNIATMKSEDESKPDAFILLVEERRSVKDISDGPVIELRWRMATRAEVKQVVARYNHSVDRKEWMQTVQGGAA